MEERQTNLLYFFFSSFLLCLHTFPHTPLPPEFKAMKNHWTETWWEQSGSYAQRLWSHPGLPHQCVSKCLKSRLAFPWENVFLYHFCLDLLSEEAHRTVQQIQSLGFSPLQRSLRSYISAWHSGPQEGKEIQDIGKNPHKVRSVFRDWLNEQFCHLQTFHSAVLFHAFDISGFEVYLGVNKHYCIRISARQQFPF